MAEESIWKSIGDNIVTYAPKIGSLLGAPGAIAGEVISSLGRAFGLGDNPGADQIKNAIATDPQAALKLMLAEQDFKLKENQQQIDQYRAETERLHEELGDVQSARLRQVETEKSTGKKDINLYVLAWIVVAGFFGLLGFLLYVPVPEDQNGVVFMLFGALATGFGQVLQYFFGSSKGSSDKTALIARDKR